MFSITADQSEKINQWLSNTIYPAIVEKQKKDPSIAKFIVKDENGVEHPYTGAIGGGLTYQFSPTSLGVITTVQWYTGEELDVTDYSDW